VHSYFEYVQAMVFVLRNNNTILINTKVTNQKAWWFSLFYTKNVQKQHYLTAGISSETMPSFSQIYNLESVYLYNILLLISSMCYNPLFSG